MAQHMRLHLVSDSTHTWYARLGVDYNTKVSIKATKLNRQKFCVLRYSSMQPRQHNMMLEVAWRRSVWITKD